MITDSGSVVLDTAKLGRSAWDLDLVAFAKLLGLDPGTSYTQEKFREFSELVRLLGRFDNKALDLLGGYEYPAAECPPATFYAPVTWPEY